LIIRAFSCLWVHLQASPSDNDLFGCPHQMLLQKPSVTDSIGIMKSVP